MVSLCGWDHARNCTCMRRADEKTFSSANSSAYLAVPLEGRVPSEQASPLEC
jgi:hypothetical protein